MSVYKTCFVLITLLVLLSGCAPASWNLAQKSYKQGDLVSAVQYSIQTLHEKPNYGQAVLFLENNLSKTYDDLTAEAEEAGRRGNWEDAHAILMTVRTISDAVASLPAQTHPTTKSAVNFPSRIVDSEMETAAHNAAEKNYQMAIALELEGKSKEAAKAYTDCMRFVSDYKDAQVRYDRSRTAAIMRVAVMPLENTSGKSQFGAIGDNLASQMIVAAMTDPANLEFLEFVSRDRLRQLVAEQKLSQAGIIDQSTAVSVGKVLGIHAFVFGKIASIVLDFPTDVITKTVEDREISLGKDKGSVNVTATVYTTTRKGGAKLTVTYQIIDVESGSIVKSGVCSKDVNQEIAWARYTGDKRALSRFSELLCDRGESPLPPVDEFVSQAVQGAAEDFAHQVAAFFN